MPTLCGNSQSPVWRLSWQAISVVVTSSNSSISAPAEIRDLLELSATLKANKRAGVRGRTLEGKSIALIFEKPSTRTRCAFTVACIDEGAHPEYLGKGDIQLGKKETVADTARVLGRMFDGIEFRGFSHDTVETLAEYAGVPVWNGLTDTWHPTQILADLLTVKEEFGRLDGLALAYVGDGRNNMANSLMVGCAKVGMDVRIVAPESLHPETELVARVREICAETGGKVTVTADVAAGVEGAHAVYTDVWASMGEEALHRRTGGAVEALQGDPGDDGGHREAGGDLPPLPAGVPQPRNRGRQTVPRYP